MNFSIKNNVEKNEIFKNKFIGPLFALVNLENKNSLMLILQRLRALL